MSRQNSASPISTRRDASVIRQQSVSGHHPNLGGVAAVSLFVAILIAFVVQSAVTQVSVARSTHRYTDVP